MFESENSKVTEGFVRFADFLREKQQETAKKNAKTLLNLAIQCYQRQRDLTFEARDEAELEDPLYSEPLTLKQF